MVKRDPDQPHPRWRWSSGCRTGSLFNLLLHATSIEGAARTVLEIWLIDGLFEVVGEIFVRSLKLLVVPLVFVSLVCGSSSMGDSARMGPIAGKTLLFYLATTALPSPWPWPWPS
jgi:Na+/H+-dicarboxylate symporter